MAYVLEPKIQQWIEPTKLTIDGVDEDIDSSTASIVFARIESRVDTSGWTDNTNTPTVILTVLSMLVASVHIRKAFPDIQDADLEYCIWLERQAENIIQAIINGTIDLGGGPPTDQPIFWPDDSTGSSQQYDAEGNPIGGPFSEDIKFTMGARF